MHQCRGSHRWAPFRQISDRTRWRRQRREEQAILQAESVLPVPLTRTGISSSSDTSDDEFNVMMTRGDEGPADVRIQAPDEFDYNLYASQCSLSSASEKSYDSSSLVMDEGDAPQASQSPLSASSQMLDASSNEETVDLGEPEQAGVFVPADGLLHDPSCDGEPIAELDDPVCQCSTTTQGELLLMVLTLGLRHNLSYAAMIDILGMVNKVYKRVVIPATMYSVLKYAEPDRSKDRYHIFCPQCQVYLQEMKESDLSVELHCTCGYVIANAKNTSSFFMTLGMKAQIKGLLERSDVTDALNYRFTRKKANEEALEDIYDGEVYKKLSSGDMPLSNPNNFSLSFNLDGIAFGNSSHQQIWPIYIVINELPPKLRVKHMLMVGVWVGNSEPQMDVFLEPFVEEANELSSTGLVWQRSGQAVSSLIIPLCCVVDSQARWRVLNMTAFNGFYGCTFCEHPTQRSRRGRRYSMKEGAPRDRTDEMMRNQMEEAFNRRHLPRKERRVKGFQGPCYLMNMNYFDLAQSLVPDNLHYLKGVVEQHLNLLLLRLTDDQVSELSTRLCCICTPSAISRNPRSLKYKEKFKASEWRSLLVLYGPVVMYGIVPSKYLSHFCLLSCAMHILLQKSVSLAQVEYCHDLIILYCALYEEYFDLESMTYNVHLLTHVPNSVVNFGPVWTHTCYPYEGQNRVTLNFASSPWKVAKVISRKYHIFNNLPNLIERFNVSDDILQFCSSIFCRPLRMLARSGNVSSIGKGTDCILSDAERDAIRQSLGFDTVNGIQFKQILVGGLLFAIKGYGRSHRKDNTGFYLRDGTKCIIQNIVKVNHGDRELLIVLAEEMIERNETLWKVQDVHLQHIKRVLRVGALLALHPTDVQGQCMFMTTEYGTFATCLPYGCVGD